MKMKSHIAQFFEVKFKYEKTQEDGLVKMVTEAYAIDAMTWSEAEKRIVEEMAAYAQGEAEIKDIRKAQYKEVLFSDKEADDKYYKTKLSFITLDEKSGKEKRQNVIYLVQAASTAQAEKYIHDVMSPTTFNYEVVKVEETKILDVYLHKDEPQKTANE